MSADTDRTDTPRSSLRSLGVAGVVAIVAIMVTMVTIILFGSPSDGDSSVSLDLAPMSLSERSNPIYSDGQATRHVGGNLVSDLALLEDSPDGWVPKIGADGRTPMLAYARNFQVVDERPRIAIVVTGLGISAAGTSATLSRLPAEVTVAFVPFEADVQRMVDGARAGGHEVLLEVPMEPFDFPNSDPGPNALLVGASAEENARRLNWAQSRFTGYVGVANLLGGRFLGEVNTIEPILEILHRQGLLFFDTGAYASSVSVTAARHVGGASAVGTIVLDAVQTPDEIDNRLAELETVARETGYAVGTASSYPVTLDRIVAWAAGQEARRFVLAPLTAVVTRPDNN